MKALFNTIFISILLTTSSLIHASPPSLERVSAFMKETNKNSNSFSTSYFKKILVPTMKFYVIINPKNNAPAISTTITKKDYLILLNDTKKLITDFKLTILSRNITFKGDFAIIDSKQLESMTVMGSNFSQKSTTKTYVKEFDGKLLITKIISTLNI